MVAMLPIVFAFQYDWVIAATWGAGAAAGALLGIWQIKLRPSGPLHALAWWKRELSYLGTWLAIQNVVFSVGAQLTVVLLAAQLGASDLGGIRAVDVVFAPMTLSARRFRFRASRSSLARSWSPRLPLGGGRGVSAAAPPCWSAYISRW